MNRLQRLFPLNSLFVKMLMYFLVIIILLSSYNIWSMTFYSRHVGDEIVKYNRTLIRNTVESFEKQYTTWKGILLTLQHNEFVHNIERQADDHGKSGIDYLQVNKITEQIRSLVSQSYYHLDNIMIYYRDHSFLIEKDGTVNDDRMFGHYYESSSYPYEFWKERRLSKEFLEALPASRFTIEPENKNILLLPLKTNVSANTWEIIAFIDVKKWYDSYRGLAGSHFFLLHEDGRLLFQSAEGFDAAQIPEWDGNSQWVLSKGTYYFFEKGEKSGLTYVNVISHSSLHQSISRMNWIAILLLALTLLIGICASWFFSRIINRPLKTMIQGLNQNEMVFYEGSISEFNAISNHLKGLQHERSQIRDWIENTKPLLTSYNYMARFKKLDIGHHAMNDIDVGVGAFMVVVYQLRYRRLPAHKGDETIYKATGKIRDVMGLHVQEAFPLSHTFQMETHQILSVIYTNEKSDVLQQCLNRIKQVLDHDRLDYLVTIGVSSLFQHSADFDQAYAESLSLIRQAKPVDETQIIWEKETTKELTGLTPEQEQEFAVNLQAGNITMCRNWVERIMDRLERQGATADQLKWFAEYVLGQIQRTLNHLNIAPEEVTDSTWSLAYCATPSQYQNFIESELSRAARLIQLKLEENYDINQYILTFLEAHYAEDISLDLLAQKLNMSSTYLSGYIKEKTGSNFSEQLNAIRIKKAKELLETTTMSVQDIGCRIGYRNVTSFIRMFKKETGQPPGDYRKKMHFRDQQ